MSYSSRAAAAGWACVRKAAAVLGICGLVVAGLLEIVLLFPVSWAVYASSVALFAAGVVRPSHGLRPTRSRVAVLAVATLAVLLFVAPWSSRKPFLADLWSLQPGMTEVEVRSRMAGYILGTGWPADPLVGSDGTELVWPDALVFRHSNHANFNSDWGIVHFRSGRVLRVEFLGD